MFPPDRAYTYVDRTRALLGNPWLERRWSAFLGTTDGLWHKPSGRVWTNVPGDELAAPVDGAARPALAFGEVAWSEEAGPFGATLVQERRGLGLVLEVRTLAFHAAPAMVRVLTLIHRAGAPQSAGTAVVDALRLSVRGGKDPAPVPMSIAADHWNGDIGAAVALQRQEGGLLVAAGAGSVVDLDVDGQQVRVTTQDMPPMRANRVVLPFSLLAFYAGRAEHEGVAAMCRAVDLWRESQAHVRRQAEDMNAGRTARQE